MYVSYFKKRQSITRYMQFLGIQLDIQKEDNVPSYSCWVFLVSESPSSGSMFLTVDFSAACWMRSSVAIHICHLPLFMATSPGMAFLVPEPEPRACREIGLGLSWPISFFSDFYA
jgi:hypothetical protein